MKKTICFLFFMVLILSLSACGGKTGDVQIIDCPSELFTDAEIDAAIDVTIDYFRKEFSGCTLTEITYIGDDKLDGYQDFAERNNADDVIVLVSSFDVDDSGGDGSLNPNDTYINWKWILVRSDGGKWVHVDHGY